MFPYLSVIIPAYNEEKTIAQTLKSIIGHLKAKNFSYEIIVVSDGSKDNTVGAVWENFPNENSIIVIDRKENKGKGYTVREGFLKASGEVRLFMDSDNATDISHFDLMKPLFDSGYDVVIASRDPKDAPGARQAVSQPWHKRMLGNAGNLFIQFFAIPGIWDTQCGFKAFTKEASEKIFSKSKIDRWSIDVELLALAKLFNYKIGIVPAYWINNPNSRVKLSNYFKFLLEVVKISGYIGRLKKEMRNEAALAKHAS